MPKRNYKLIFRIVMLLSVITFAIALTFGVLLLETLPKELLSYISFLETKETTITEMFLGLFGIFSILILLPILTIGLWFFKIWAKTLYLMLTIFSLFLYPFIGPVIMNPWEALFTDLSFMLSGATIAMMFYHPVEEIFNIKNNERS